MFDVCGATGIWPRASEHGHPEHGHPEHGHPEHGAGTNPPGEDTRADRRGGAGRST